MEATLSLNYSQIWGLVTQMPIRSQLRLGKALTRKSTEQELRHFLDTFKTDEISEESIIPEEKSATNTAHRLRRR